MCGNKFEFFALQNVFRILLAVLIISVGMGYYIYSGSLGWGDSLNQLSKPLSIYEFVVMWWSELNGRIGQAVLYAVFLIPIRWLANTPEQYPWWLIRSLALFCTLSAPLLLAAAMPKSIRPHKKFGILSMVLYFWIIWTFNPVTYETSAWFTTAEFVGYSGPIFLISLIFLLFVRRTLSDKPLPGAVALTAFGFAIAVMGEQYLLAYPVLVLGVATVGVANKKISHTNVVRIMSFTLVGIVAGALTYWSAPAQQARNQLLGLHFDNLWVVYKKSILFGYQFLFQKSIQSSVLLGILVVIHTAIIIFAVLWAWNDLKRKGFAKIYVYPDAGILLLTLLMAYQACFVTLVVSDYFPGYAAIFPGLLLAVSLLILSLPLFGMVKIGLHGKRRNVFATVAMLLVCFVLFAWLSVSDFKRNSSTENFVRANDKFRKSAYAVILNDALTNSESQYVLIDCPLAAPQYGWSMEPPWGLQAYLRWKGAEHIQLYLHGNYDLPSDWSNGGYKIISCSTL